MLEEGHDPNARYAIRAGLVGDSAVEMTPLEAAEAADLVNWCRCWFTLAQSLLCQSHRRPAAGEHERAFWTADNAITTLYYVFHVLPIMAAWE